MAVPGVFSKLFQEPNVFYTLAGISGTLAVALGAYGSHCAFCSTYYSLLHVSLFQILNFF